MLGITRRAAALGAESAADDFRQWEHVLTFVEREEMPPEFDEVVGRLEAGQSPEEIESAVPNLGDVAASDDD